MKKVKTNLFSIILISCFTFIFSFYFLPTYSYSQKNQIDKVKTLYSKILEEERKIVIQLPENYNKPNTTTYPVLFLLDAEGGNSWENAISTTKKLSSAGKTPEIILVGIHNTNRNRDMIPEKVGHRPGSGGSNKFLQFIIEELVPHVKSQFRINNFNILFGGSNAGLFTVYALIEHQEIIQAGIAGSPMIGHCSDFMFDQLNNALENKFEKDRYLFMIYGENDSKRVVDYVPKYFDLLKNGVASNFKTENVILKNEDHVPESSLNDGLIFIFKDKNK